MYSKILTALDGSDESIRAGEIALKVAAPLGAEILACHVYGAELHSRRFGEMEPALPEQYQDSETLSELRGAHGSLILDGFRALAGGYLAAFVASAGKAGVPAATATVEGRNYVGILGLARQHAADLIALGTRGLGAIGDGQLGSTAGRVLRHARRDVLLAQRPLNGGPVCVGIDGGGHALAALRRAVAWAQALEAPVHLAAAYDPDFHTAVFRAMAERLSAECNEQVGLTAQEDLHDRIINDGLGKLYQGFLDEAADLCRTLGVEPESALLTGKAYKAVADYAEQVGADLLVVGRLGHHAEDISQLGSNAEAAARTGRTNVLVAAVEPRPAEARGQADWRPAQAKAPSADMAWDDDALARLQRVPPFARPMARRATEEHVAAEGRRRVTLADFDNLARRFGMGPGARESDAPDP
jgi:nucleotide-binding universal stress UspA family protein